MPTATQDNNIMTLIVEGLISVDPSKGRIYLKGKGFPMGTVTKAGYIRSEVRLDKKRIVFYNHRAIYIHEHGVPLFRDIEIDHVNTLKMDNRISNLEGVTRQENARRAVKSGSFRDMHLRRKRDERGRFI